MWPLRSQSYVKSDSLTVEDSGLYSVVDRSVVCSRKLTTVSVSCEIHVVGLVIAGLIEVCRRMCRWKNNGSNCRMIIDWMIGLVLTELPYSCLFLKVHSTRGKSFHQIWLTSKQSVKAADI